MQTLLYYLALPFLYLISMLPYFIFYGFSDILFFILYFVIGYRKKVVRQNLKNSFPNKTEKELREIEKKFYRFLTDVTLETFRGLTKSKKWMAAHCTMSPKAQKLFDSLYHENKSMLTAMGHFGNWEMAGSSFGILCKQPLYVIYHPISNKYFNQLMIKLRSRFGNIPVSMRDTPRAIVKLKNECSGMCFINDQTPPPENAYWTTFLNQDTPIYTGIEKIAQKTNLPLLYVGVQRVSRGYYTVHAELLAENCAQTKEGELTELHTRRLEKDILAKPETWLWSHKRWKHKRNLKS